jgi:hypothetical protein
MLCNLEWKINNLYEMMLKGEIDLDIYQMMLSVYADELLEEHGYDHEGRKVI